MKTNKKNKVSANTINCIVSKTHNEITVAIVLAKDWFKVFYIENKMPYFIPKDSYVVCRWHDFNDGLKCNIEGKQTIAICKNKTDAEVIYAAN